MVAQVLAEVSERGACTARDLDDGAPRSKENWGWNWSEARKALDYLYSCGELAIAGRNSAFECVYDLPERVLPAAVLAAAGPQLAEANRELIRRAARSHGFGTMQCLRDYYRDERRRTPARRSRAGRGRRAPAGGRSRAGSARPTSTATPRCPRKVDARAVLSPFDPVVWERERTEQIFDFHYRIEIYVPEEKRQFGYYVLPFLLGDRIVGRVDLKADRKGGRLLVKAAYAEPGAPAETAHELAEELRDVARWLALDDLVVSEKGDLAPALAAELR